MSFPILVEAQNGHFAASLPGVPDLSIVEATREQAIAGLKAALQQRVAQGELLSVEIETGGVIALAGTYSDDPTLRDICAAAYQLRDAEAE